MTKTFFKALLSGPFAMIWSAICDCSDPESEVGEDEVAIFLALAACWWWFLIAVSD